MFGFWKSTLLLPMVVFACSSGSQPPPIPAEPAPAADAEPAPDDLVNEQTEDAAAADAENPAEPAPEVDSAAPEEATTEAVEVADAPAQETAEAEPEARAEDLGEPEAPAEAAEPVVDKVVIAAGSKLWRKKCKSCHGKRGTKAKKGKLKLQNLTDADWQTSVADADLTKAIAEGKGEPNKKGRLPMPAYAEKLGEEKIRSLVAFIRTLER